MSDKKEFLGILLSVLICFFLIFIGVYATTIVGNNITTGGSITINGAANTTELSVVGTASISEDLWVSGSFQFAGGEETATASYSRLGSATSGHSLLDADDLLITGLLEVDDVAHFDSLVSVSSSGILMDNGVNIITGTASPQGSTTNCTVGDIYILAGGTLDTILNVCDETNVWTPADL